MTVHCLYIYLSFLGILPNKYLLRLNILPTILDIDLDFSNILIKIFNICLAFLDIYFWAFT